MKTPNVIVLSLNNIQKEFWKQNLQLNTDESVLQFNDAERCLQHLQENQADVLIIDLYFCRNEEQIKKALKVASFSKVRTWIFTPNTMMHTNKKNVLVKCDYFSNGNLCEIQSLLDYSENEAA
ncbi:MAG TPA: hypothetical protein DIU39_03020 [Flavobacteriales bacterium]|nr:hypothetical protein [Flavobacteriales bacterium]|tara:strand:+ start:76494 stop:76862 length:369 start_codon:yes stop_codon:yes gene_type:complete